MSMTIGSTASYGQLVIIWWYPKDVHFGVPFLLEKYFWIPDNSSDILFVSSPGKSHATVDGSEIQNNHLGCKVPCKY